MTTVRPRGPHHSTHHIFSGESTPRGGLNPSRLPNPRTISWEVHLNHAQPPQGNCTKEANPLICELLRGGPVTPEDSGVSHMLMQWGQFVAHDIILTSQDGEKLIEKVKFTFNFRA